MRKTKFLTTALLCGVASLSLASCGGDNKNVINFYCSAGNTLAPTIQKRIDEFNKEHSGYEVKIVNPGDYDKLKDKIKSDLKVNNQPAIAYCYPDHIAEYLDGSYKNKVIDLQSRFIDKDEEFKKINFVQSYYDEGKMYEEGKLYTLPFQRSTEVMYVNMDQLNAAGVKPEELATWEGLFAALPKIYAKKDSFNIKTYNKVLGYDSEANFFITIAEQYGIPYTANGDTAENTYLFNNDQSVDFLKRLNKAYNDNLFTTQTKLGGYTSNEFVKGNITISIGSTGGANHQDPQGAFEYAVLPLPYKAVAEGETPVRKQISQGPSLVMFEQSSDEKEDVAWEFVKELLSNDLQVEYSSNSGYLPVTEDALNSDVFKAFLEEKSIMSQTIKVSAEYKDSLFVSPAFNGSNKARTQIGIVLAETLGLTGDLDAQIKKLLQEAYDECTYFN